MSSHLQKKIISLLDVAGSTIVDIFYNHMYDHAIAMKEKTENNITDCYRLSIIEYVNTSNTSDFYKKLMNSIHYITRVSTIYHNISLSQCVDLYLSLFVPDQYVLSLTERQKHDILSNILRETIKSFSNELLTEHLAMIIDEHYDESNLAILQDVILREFIRHRNEHYSRFVKCEQNKIKSKKKKSIIVKPSPISQKSLSKINKLYKQVVEQKEKLKQKNVDLQEKYTTLVKQTKELKDIILMQITRYKEQEKELNKLKASSTTTIFKTSTPHAEDTNGKDNQNTIHNYIPISYVDEERKENEPVDYDDSLFNVQYVSEE